MDMRQDLAEAIVDPTAHADRQRLDQVFTRLRRESPIARATPNGFDPFWVVTRYADIQAISRANDLFHNGDRATAITPIELDRQVRASTGGSPHLLRTIVQMDDSDHIAYPRLAPRWLLPQNVRVLEA